MLMSIIAALKIVGFRCKVKDTDKKATTTIKTNLKKNWPMVYMALPYHDNRFSTSSALCEKKSVSYYGYVNGKVTTKSLTWCECAYFTGQ